jgi:hypothetical protein
MKHKILIIIALFLSASSLFAQDVDDIINNYFENTGGADNWKNLKTMQLTADFEQGGMQMNMILYQNKDNMRRVDVEFQGNTIIQAYDGEVGWMVNPFMGIATPQKMPQEMLDQMTAEKFESEFMNYQEKGHEVELEGKEEIEGSEAYKVKLTKNDGDVEYFYFDTENFVPIMQRQTVKYGPGQGQEAETYISDYQEVEGFLMPFLIDSKMNGQSVMKMIVEKYILNEEIDPSIFTMPKGSDSPEE